MAHGTHLLQGGHVELFRVAEDGDAARFAGHAFVGKAHDVIEGEVGECVVDALVDVVVDAALLSR